MACLHWSLVSTARSARPGCHRLRGAGSPVLGTSRRAAAAGRAPARPRRRAVRAGGCPKGFRSPSSRAVTSLQACESTLETPQSTSTTLLELAGEALDRGAFVIFPIDKPGFRRFGPHRRPTNRSLPNRYGRQKAAAEAVGCSPLAGIGPGDGPFHAGSDLPRDPLLAAGSPGCDAARRSTRFARRSWLRSASTMRSRPFCGLPAGAQRN